MKRALSVILPLLSALACGITFLTATVQADVTVLSSGPGNLLLSYCPGGIRVDSLTVNGAMYVRFSFDGHILTGSPGEPSLPSKMVLFAAPPGSVPSIVTDGLTRSFRTGVTVAPRPSLVADRSGFTQEVYTEDPVRYNMSGYNPADFVGLGKRFDIGGVWIWELVFTPVLFDARARTAAVADSFRVSVTWTGDFTSPFNANKIPDTIINREMLAARMLQKSAAPAVETVNLFATGDWYRIAVADSGMYSIVGSELAATGFPVGSANTGDIRIYYGGGRMLDIEPHELSAGSFREIALRVRDVNGDGVFGAEDSIIFYGEALSRFIALTDTEAVVFQNHPYSSTNIYWLTLSKSGSPLRMETFPSIPSDTVPARTTFREILHLERETSMVYPESGIEWYWDEIKGTTSKYYSFGAPGSVSGDSVVVRVAFLNPPPKNEYSSDRLEHSIEIYVNSTGPFNRTVPRIESSCVEMRFRGSFAEKGNFLSIRRLSGGSGELIQLDWFELEYDRRLEFSEKNLEFFVRGAGEPTRFVVGNVQKSTLELFDTTDPYRVTEITGAVYDSRNHTLAFQVVPPAGRFSRFTIFDPDLYRKVSSVTRKNRSDLRNPLNGTDYIAITHRMFLDEAKKLADWRGRDSIIEPLKSMVVDIADIYDEFAWGVLDPVAIRDFLKYAGENYHPGVRYCCLIGDATYKYKNINPGQNSKNLVPTFSYREIATDDFFTWNDNTLSPMIAIGRFCVNTVEEARTVVDKTIEYERNPEMGMWHSRALLIADDEKGENQQGHERDFSLNIEDFDRQKYIPKWIERVKIMEIEYPMKNYMKPDATEALLAAFNDGAVLANYVGHGNKDLLAHEHILVGPRDIERFNNGGRQSVFIIASCSVGAFDRVDYTSLAEILHLRKGGGCIAVIAATRDTYNSSNVELNRAFYINLFNRNKNPDCRIGLALKLAKANLQITDISLDYNNRYVIFGDPATRLMVPRYGFTVSPVDTLRLLQKVGLAGSVSDAAKGIPYTGTLTVTARGPAISKKYIIAAGYEIPYTMPGRTFYRGEIPISGEGFRTSFVVPKDLASETSAANILLFATGEGKEAAGILENLPIGAPDPTAPGDVSGPEIRLSFDGKSFESGDYVKRQPSLTAILTDPSGINVYGNRGHNVTVTLDRTEVTVLTDEVTCRGACTNGVFAHTFPILIPGEHTLEVNAYDSYNNVTKKEAILNVVGSETGEISIQNLLAYPNPMRSDGTTFTFSLTDDAGSADIKIYSQSGRQVDAIRFRAGHGFNPVFWKPPFELANGVYFYKLTVRSLNGRKATKIEKLAVIR